MRHTIIAAAGLWLYACSAQAQVTATQWGAYCWTQGGGAGTKWCQASVEFSASDGRNRFKGSLRVMRSEHGEIEATIAGDRDIDRGSLQVDGGAIYRAPEDFDAKLSATDTMALRAAMQAGRLLILRFTPKGMPPVAFSLDLDGYRAAVRGNELLER